MGMREFFGDFFYEQERVGRGGKTIMVRKIKTMRDGDRDRTPAAAAQRLAGDQVDENAVTLLGSVLRASGLDELPQVENVARGEMRLTGLRAVTREEFDLLPPDVQARYIEEGPAWLPLDPAFGGLCDTLAQRIARMRFYIYVSKILEQLDPVSEAFCRAVLAVPASYRHLTDPRRIAVIRLKFKQLLACAA